MKHSDIKTLCSGIDHRRRPFSCSWLKPWSNLRKSSQKTKVLLSKNFPKFYEIFIFVLCFPLLCLCLTWFYSLYSILTFVLLAWSTVFCWFLLGALIASPVRFWWSPCYVMNLKHALKITVNIINRAQGKITLTEDIFSPFPSGVWEDW